MVPKPEVKGEKPKLLVILGPTAAGKTRFGIDIARSLEAEIISADSLQVYKYFDIGTAKPTPEERTEVRHHLIDIVYPDQDFNAGKFRETANSVIESLHKSSTKTILIGGTYLYVRVLLSGLIEDLPADEEIRGGLRKLRSERGVDYVYDKLMSLDPEAASKIHPNDYIRIERALEVCYLTGQKVSKIRSQHKFDDRDYEYLKIGIYRERQPLRDRIDARVDDMIKKGLVDEVQNLGKMGYGRELKPMQSIGYKEINRYLEGEISLERAIELIKRDTKRFAKRQMTWLRRDKEIKWLETPGDYMRVTDAAARFFGR
ncbi:MAG: tRNA (adenosine(37)-N6)-dimethylallyltransferase MiaA [Deltaproteobacteria bacterium]